ncbi:MAG: type II secretion system protein GspG [Archangium sp.]|nr:type II secretion system protein GspG [Archangium sp.]
MKRQRSRRGISLIEIIVVITIISMLMSAVGVYALGVHRTAQINTARMDVRNAASALDVYRASHGRYPDPSEGFAPVIKSRALKTAPMDPWHHPLSWELRDGEAVVISLGADGVKGGVDDNADLSSSDPED